MEYKVDGIYKNTKVLTGELARKKRRVIDTLASVALGFGYEEIFLPLIEYETMYIGRLDLLTFPDRDFRSLCLRPDGTLTCQLLSKSLEKDAKIFYVTECFTDQTQFTQLGVQRLNPQDIVKAYQDIRQISVEMIRRLAGNYVFKADKKGFEIELESLDEKQVCTGGTHTEGCGFSYNIDRLMLIL